MNAKHQPLTTLEAAKIGRAMGVRGLCIYRDELDRELWRVVTPGRNEVHEPMDEKTWRAFITASGWITRPHDTTADERVFDALREQLSPHAIAAIASYLQTNRTSDPAVDREVDWFRDQLCELLGGGEAQSRLAEELGL
jgi:hypothetical protein